MTLQPPTLGWSGWISLDERSSLRQLPATAGLYRVRAVDEALLAYVGQTGRSLRERVSALRGAFGREMPYRDPHTAAPALWAWLQSEPGALIVSVCPVDGDTPRRKALEAIVIAEHRQQHGVSPRWNFGRMPAGYRMSSANNASLVAAGTRHRGGSINELLSAHAPGIAPEGPLDHHVQADRWCGHHWGSWHPLNNQQLAAMQPGNGLYRIRGRDAQLVYIGEGNVRDRVRTHAAKLRHTSPQGKALAAAAPLEYSAVLNPDWLPHERLELETDLVAAHTIAFGAPPAAQFIG